MTLRKLVFQPHPSIKSCGEREGVIFAELTHGHLHYQNIACKGLGRDIRFDICVEMLMARVTNYYDVEGKMYSGPLIIVIVMSLHLTHESNCVL